MSEDETLAVDADLEERLHPPPHACLPEIPAPGSNVAYLSKDEHDRLISVAITLGLGQFRMMSEHDHRLDLERRLRRG
ncbi:MAG: hypothetical protein EON91_02800 [Brevundimonas sp.]|uniref:hypothetical protein n=1 Tax=Brevundimonas sp. TaxID=1871086 RepID=UPI001201097B|nr:hypothetical protein [Brevundimonas sp.]RZJ19143.1 MAG: hypothetical protein EON91_02800 [Brevundimonas sp.]